MRKRRLELLVWSFLLSLAYYPDYFGFLVWVSLVRPCMIIARLSGRHAFNAGYFFGFFFNAFTLYWIAQTTPPGTITTVLIVALCYATVLWMFNRLYHIRPVIGMIALPFLWVGMEYARTLTEFAFPWSDLGYTQSYYLYILQIVSVISVHGLSLVIVAVNVLFWQLFRRELIPERRLAPVFTGVAVIAVLVAYGWAVMPRIPVPGKLDVAVLQGSVPLDKKWQAGNEDYSFRLYDSLAKSVSDSDVVLYVWPETAAPTYLSHDPRRSNMISRIAQVTGGRHLVGALGATRVEGELRHFNSCFFFDSSGQVLGRYDKIKLVPFTEQVPYHKSLSFLRRDFLTKYLTFIETYDVQWWSDFLPGDSIRLFEVDDALFGVLICFESTFPELARQMILDGADFIVGITNDTWFGHSVGIHMHARIFATRAVENRCWMVRAANSGISYIVDGYGRIRGQLPLDAKTALKGEVNRMDGFSLFTRYGDVAGKASLLITVLLIAILILRWLVRKLLSTGQPG